MLGPKTSRSCGSHRNSRSKRSTCLAHRAFAVVLLLCCIIGLTGCPQSPAPSGGDGPADAIDGHTESVATDDASDQTVDINLSAEGRDCTPNIHGEVAADEALRDAFEIDRYAYEYSKDTGAVAVEMLGDGDELLGSLDFMPTTSTQVRAFPRDLFSAGVISGTFKVPGGDTIDVRFYNRAQFEVGPPVRNPEGVADVEIERRFIGMTIDDKTLWIAGSAPTAGADVDVEPLYLVPVEQATGAPPNTDVVLRTFEQDGEWDEKEYYALDLDADTTADEVEGFLAATGFLSSFAGNVAVDRLLLLLADPSWVRESLIHVGSCIDGEDISGAWPGALNAAGCLSALDGVVETQTLHLATGGAVAACAGSLFACPAVPLAHLATLRSAASTVADAAACFCSNPKNELIGCGYTGCEVDTCEAACAAKSFPMCDSPTTVYGRCVESDLGQIESFGFTANHCECVVEVSEDDMGCATGDPHITTFDGMLYSPQIAGEFIMARSDDADFELQARMEPAATTVCPSFAYTTAVAFRWGSHEASFYYEEEGTTLFIDDERYDEATFTSLVLADGTSVTRAEDWLGNEGWAVDTSDGVRLVVLRAHAHLQLMLVLADDAARDIEGLLGRIDGDPENDLQSPDGTVFQSPISYVALAELVGAPWRVDDEASLFDYATGESTASYIVANFPDALLSEQSLPEERADAARSICEEAGVTNVDALAACVIDVACTDDATLVSGHSGNDSATTSIEVVDATLFDDWQAQGLAAPWELAGRGASASQPIDGRTPSFLVSPNDIEPGTHVGGYMRTDAGDDDIIGFVFGYQAPITGNSDDPHTFDTFVFGWKRGAQDQPNWGAASEGMYLAHVHGTAADKDEAASWFWAPDDESVDRDSVEVIATNFAEDTGYDRNRWLRFDLYYSATGIRIDIEGEVVFDVPATSFASPIVAGRFGFLSLSQPAEFTGFFAKEMP